ncbi:hypothetical protein ACIO14_07365 [Nocardia fluminea]|uniref:hypothetical protein n=1 Tax=Nocardia fluminea TaxID=134984 RepID=UPI003803A393
MTVAHGISAVSPNIRQDTRFRADSVVEVQLHQPTVDAAARLVEVIDADPVLAEAVHDAIPADPQLAKVMELLWFNPGVQELFREVSQDV